jgi:hypothetical protein
MLTLFALSLAHAEPAPLVLPEAQECIVGLFADDPEMAVYDGLSVEQLRESLGSFRSELLRCAVPGRGLRGSVELELTIGCDGRVAAVTIEESAGLTDETAQCLADTLSYAPFPAHDMPDGVIFRYPMVLDVPAGARLVQR